MLVPSWERNRKFLLFFSHAWRQPSFKLKATFADERTPDNPPPTLRRTCVYSIEEDKFFENSLAQFGDLETDDIWGTVS